MLDIKILMSGIDKTFCESSIPVVEKINDIVILTSFIGNDFLPPLSYLKIRNGGLDVLYRIYNYVLKNQESMRMIDPSTLTINWLFIEQFLKELCKTENVSFSNANENYYNKRPFNKSKDKSDKQYILDNYVALNKFNVCIDSSKIGWYNDYYSLLFPKYKNIDIVKNACKRYTDGLEWNIEYYFHGKLAPISDWYYPFIYSPTINDLSKYISMKVHMNDISPMKFNKKIYEPNMQLLLVLPEESILKYLPKYEKLIKDPSYDCMHMYPSTFKIMTYLKNQLWECSPILPEMDDECLETGIIKLNKLIEFN